MCTKRNTGWGWGPRPARYTGLSRCARPRNIEAPSCPTEIANGANLAALAKTKISSAGENGQSGKRNDDLCYLPLLHPPVPRCNRVFPLTSGIETSSVTSYCIATCLSRENPHLCRKFRMFTDFGNLRIVRSRKVQQFVHRPGRMLRQRIRMGSEAARSYRSG